MFNVAAVDCLAKTRKPASSGKALANELFPSRRCVTATRRARKDARALGYELQTMPSEGSVDEKAIRRELAMQS